MWLFCVNVRLSVLWDIFPLEAIGQYPLGLSWGAMGSEELWAIHGEGQVLRQEAELGSEPQNGEEILTLSRSYPFMFGLWEGWDILHAHLVRGRWHLPHSRQPRSKQDGDAHIPISHPEDYRITSYSRVYLLKSCPWAISDSLVVKLLTNNFFKAKSWVLYRYKTSMS